MSRKRNGRRREEGDEKKKTELQVCLLRGWLKKKKRKEYKWNTTWIGVGCRDNQTTNVSQDEILEIVADSKYFDCEGNTHTMALIRPIIRLTLHEDLVQSVSLKVLKNDEVNPREFLSISVMMIMVSRLMSNKLLLKIPWESYLWITEKICLRGDGRTVCCRVTLSTGQDKTRQNWITIIEVKERLLERHRCLVFGWLPWHSFQRRSLVR